MALSGGAALIPVKPLVTPGQFTSSGKKAGEEFSDGFYRDASGRLRRANGQFANDAENAAHGGGKRAGKKFGSGFAASFKGMVGSLVAPLAFGALIKSSVQIRAEFEKTLNTLGAVAGVQGAKLKNLEQLAIDLGNSTVFSANEAAAAMLELAKGGITEADIRAGALRGTLLLAAAGGTDLATAAGIASNAMNTFGLSGKSMNKVANALAGGANASTASVESLGQALSQVGPGAVNAGLDINETVGALAAFDSAGIKGSDAGTSLKTMLARLVPQTDAAESAMKKLGLNFVKRNGDFQSLGNIAQQLQDKLGGLSQAERSRALTTIFGSDATRAASVLMNEGAKGLGKYVKATKDQKSAQNAANAAMKGLPGALERLSGAWETFRLQIGKALAPGVIAGATILADAMGGLVPFVQQNADTFRVLGQIIVVGAAAWAGYALGVKLSTIWTALHTAGTIRATIAQKLLNRAVLMNPIGLLVGALFALGAGLVIAYKKSETFRRIVDAAWAGIKRAVKSAWEGFIRPALMGFGRFLTNVVAPAIRFLWRNVVAPTFRAIGTLIKVWWNVIVKPVFSALKFYFSKVLFPVIRFLWNHVVKPVFGAVAARIRRTWEIVRPILSAFGNFISDRVAPAFRRGVDAVGRAWDRVKAVAKKPVNFVIDTVYNNGLRSMFNSVAGKLGMKTKLPYAQPIGGAGRTRPAFGGAGRASAFGGAGRSAHAHPEAMGGPFDFVKNAVGNPFDWFKDKVTGGVDSLLGKVGSGPFGDMAKGAVRKVAGFATDFLKGKFSTASAATGPKGKAGRVLPAGSYRIGMPYLGYPGHYGADYPAPAGTPVSSPWAGRVSKVASLTSSYGKHIYVDHGNGVQTRYAHLSALGVKAGQQILPGGFLGRVGSTGNSTGNHLHFEYRRNGSPSNPAGLGIFDSGGMLPTGLSAVFNGTGKPEAVFTADQLQTLERIANQGAGGFPSRAVLVVDGYEFNAYVDARADGKVTAARELDDMMGRAD